MKSLKIFLSLFLFSILLIVAGCNKDNNPTDPGNNNNTGNNSNPLPTEFGGATPTHVFGLVRTSVTQSGYTFSTGVGFASLNNQDKGDVSVKVSGTDYLFAKNTSSGNTSYSFPNPQNPTQIMTLPSSTFTATFDVTGYTLQQKNVQVPGELALTAPAANSTVPRTSDLTVSWAVTGAGANNAIFISDMNGNSKFKQNLGNVTSATFSASELGSLAAGDAIVYALSYNFVLSNNNEAVLIGQALALSSIKLQ
jgi:hypothetical protein